MHRLRSLIPSANHLFVFEAAARRGSFTAASEELNVSQPAVSKAVKALEEATGLQLFRRMHTRVELTAEGQRLYKETQQMFDQMYMVLSSLRSKSSADTVRVSFSTSFVQLWLLPRLKDFKTKHPGVSLRIEETTRENFDLDMENVDISSRLGNGKWPGLQAAHFATEEVIPVCSPDYLVGLAPIRSVESLLTHSLLHFEEKHRARMGWKEWFAHHAVHVPRLPMDFIFTDNHSSIEAAVHGQGIALAWKHLVQDHLRSGRLVCPIPVFYRSGKSIYLVTPMRRTPKAGALLFRDWLLAQEADAALPFLLG